MFSNLQATSNAFHWLLLLPFMLFAQSGQAKNNHVSANKQQGTPFHKESNSLCFGLGLGLAYNYYSNVSNSPALFIAFDHGIADHIGPGNIGIGAMIGYKSSVYHYKNGGYKAVWRNTIIGARGTWHLTAFADKHPKFDPYAGLTVGFRITSYHDSYFSNNPNIDPIYSYGTFNPMAGIFIGAKYNFTPSIGAFAEMGYDISFLKAGIHFNF